MNDDIFLSAAQVAALLAANGLKACAATIKKHIPSEKRGGRRVYRRSDVVNWINGEK